MSAPFPGPWVYDGVAYIQDAEGNNVAMVRGWGHLTGKGGLGLSDSEAVVIQNTNGLRLAAVDELISLLGRYTYCDKVNSNTDNALYREATALLERLGVEE